MKSSGTSFTYTASFKRIDEVLAAPDENFPQRDDLPSRDDLTFSNGYFVRVAALFVDIRNSSNLPGKYSEPALAKLYRAFISEVVAVLDGSPDCDEINIVGDGVWGVFDARLKEQVDRVVEAAGRVSSLLDGLNARLLYRGYEALRVGIGLDWGRALMIKTGFYGSGVNDIVYVGNVVNSAAKLCSLGEQKHGSGYRPRVMAGREFVNNLLPTGYAGFFTYDASIGCYTASIQNKAMTSWLADNPPN
ncbi:adenylate/guanylate cyclase domain-containing protein [Nocardioides conyzicola]|uniref:Adenylate/guanylate cyclase domain-containing protein n=1 Tax=Nocardioides conyzicola TaxID=1651781 RepID=A0ABP8XZD3_9ACTN